MSLYFYVTILWKSLCLFSELVRIFVTSQKVRVDFICARFRLLPEIFEILRIFISSKKVRVDLTYTGLRVYGFGLINQHYRDVVFYFI
jgi:hypothetical protein